MIVVFICIRVPMLCLRCYYGRSIVLFWVSGTLPTNGFKNIQFSFTLSACLSNNKAEVILIKFDIGVCH
jgi:hypothetical protein